MSELSTIFALAPPSKSPASDAITAERQAVSVGEDMLSVVRGLDRDLARQPMLYYIEAMVYDCLPGIFSIADMAASENVVWRFMCVLCLFCVAPTTEHSHPLDPQSTARACRMMEWLDNILLDASMEVFGKHKAFPEDLGLVLSELRAGKRAAHEHGISNFCPKSYQFLAEVDVMQAATMRVHKVAEGRLVPGVTKMIVDLNVAAHVLHHHEFLTAKKIRRDV